MDYRIIFFVLSLLAAAPVLIHYYRSNPNPRFRPKPGEMAMVSIIALLICGGLSWFVGGLLEDPQKMRFNEALTRPSEGDGNRPADRPDEPRQKTSKDRPGTPNHH